MFAFLQCSYKWLVIHLFCWYTWLLSFAIHLFVSDPSIDFDNLLTSYIFHASWKVSFYILWYFIERIDILFSIYMNVSSTLQNDWKKNHIWSSTRGTYRASQAWIALGSARARLTFHELGSARVLTEFGGAELVIRICGSSSAHELV